MKESTLKRYLKRLELAMRATYISFLSRRAQKIAQLPLKLPPKPTILFLRHDLFGDAIITTPLLAAMHEKFPDARLLILLSKKNESIAALLPVACDIFVYQKNFFRDRSLLRQLRSQKIDVLIDLQANASVTSSMIVARNKANYTIGINKENSSVYNIVVPNLDQTQHTVARRIAELLRPFEIDPETINLRPRLNIPKRETIPGKIGINISVGKASRFVPVLIQTQIAQSIAELDDVNEVLIFAAPGDSDAQREVVHSANHKKVIAAPIMSSYSDFAAIISECEYLITPDTSVVQLGAALQIPMTIIFRTTPGLHLWTPYGVRYEAIVKDTFDDLHADEVVDAFSSLRRKTAVKANVEAEAVL